MVYMSERVKKIYRRSLWLFLSVCVVAVAVLYIYTVKNKIPDTLNLSSKSEEEVNFHLPFIGTVQNIQNAANLECISSDVNVVSAKALVMSRVDLSRSINIRTGEIGNYKLQFNLFGIFNIKNVDVNVCDEKMVIPCGNPIGIYLKTDGVMVVDVGDIITKDGVRTCPASELLWPGDYIVAVDDVEVDTKKELVDAINGKDDSMQKSIRVRRNGEFITVNIQPVVNSDGKRMIGVWVRDDCQGLGTLTYIDENDKFGALGHGVSDIDTGKKVEVDNGKLYTAKIWSIEKGKAGKPGEVVGSINYDKENMIGEIKKNTDVGIYGMVSENIYNFVQEFEVPITFKQNVKTGKASIRSFINGEIKEYDIVINSTDMSNSNTNKGITFTVTDEYLLNLTGGIIQGLSGSPILQDGKMIGAVTHVLVNDPTKGYGIFIENMLEN